MCNADIRTIFYIFECIMSETRVAENIARLMDSLPEGVKLIPISKTMPEELIMQGWSAGYKVYGENKVQELTRKYEKLPKDIEWHMVGHLQTNKVKYIAPFVHLIQGVDRMKVLRVMNTEAQKTGRILRGLFQIHIAQEETKFGFDEEELLELLQSEAYGSISNVQMVGVMGMATFTDDSSQVRKEFQQLYRVFQRLKRDYFSADPDFNEISMGMSNDYKIALEEGSTMVRIGSLIFGPRDACSISK
jgi:hypothetical protein